MESVKAVIQIDDRVVTEINKSISGISKQTPYGNLLSCVESLRNEVNEHLSQICIERFQQNLRSDSSEETSDEEAERKRRRKRNLEDEKKTE